MAKCAYHAEDDGLEAYGNADQYQFDAVGPPTAANSGSMHGAEEQVVACPGAASGPIRIVRSSEIFGSCQSQRSAKQPVAASGPNSPLRRARKSVNAAPSGSVPVSDHG